jgi:hypothetical protein
MHKLSTRTLFSILYLVSVVNCYNVVIPEKENARENMEDIKIMNDFIVKPIEEFDAYFQQGSSIYGISKNIKNPGELVRFLPVIEIDSKEQVTNFESFYVKSGKVYFSIKVVFPVEDADPEIITKYCEQLNGEISYITKTKYGNVPAQVRIEAEEGDYKFSIGDYEGQPISIVERDYSETLIFVDGFLIIEGGVLINAVEGRGSARPNALLFWPDGKRTMDTWKGSGRFWK